MVFPSCHGLGPKLFAVCRYLQPSLGNCYSKRFFIGLYFLFICLSVGISLVQLCRRSPYHIYATFKLNLAAVFVKFPTSVLIRGKVHLFIPPYFNHPSTAAILSTFNTRDVLVGAPPVFRRRVVIILTILSFFIWQRSDSNPEPFEYSLVLCTGFI